MDCMTNFDGLVDNAGFFYRMPKRILTGQDSIVRVIHGREKHTALKVFLAIAVRCDAYEGIGRVAISHICKVTGLSKNTVKANITRLEEAGVLGVEKVVHFRGEANEFLVELPEPGDSWFPVFRDLVESSVWRDLSPAEASLYLAKRLLGENFDHAWESEEFKRRKYDFVDATKAQLVAASGVARSKLDEAANQLRASGLVADKNGSEIVLLHPPAVEGEESVETWGEASSF